MSISRASISSFALVTTLHLGGLAALLLMPSSPPKAEISAPSIQGLIIMAQAEPAPAPAQAQTPVEVKKPEPLPAKIKPATKNKPERPHKAHKPQHAKPNRQTKPQAAAPSPQVSQPAPSAAPISQAQPAPIAPPTSDSPQLRNPAPAYPGMSRKLREQGTVILRLLVKANGRVESVSIKQSSGYKRLDDTALRTVRRWRFNPATQAGMAVDYWYELPVEFSLK